MKHKIVEGTAIYGHWLGPIAKGSMFDRGSPFAQHGWVLMPDTRIVDPTRWVFEGVEPYIYIGPNDHYDEGGTRFRRMTRRPMPRYDPSDGAPVHFSTRDLPTAAWNFVEKLFEDMLPFDDLDYKPGTLSGGQVMWLANLAPEELGDHAKVIYEALQKKRLGGLVPIDNLRRVEQGRG